MLSLGNLNTVIQMKDSNTFTSDRYLKITDLYDNKDVISLNVFLNCEDSVEKLVNAYIQMLKVFGCNYYEIDNQSVEYIGECNFGEEFILGGNSALNQTISQIDTVITPLRSIQIGYETAKNMNLSKNIETGQFFTKEDYLYDCTEKIIPVLLGNNYKEQLELGNTFEFYYLGEKKFTGKVIGFFSKGTSIDIDQESISLDYQIIMPSLEIQNTNISINEKHFLAILYLLKTEGYILYKSEKDYENITTKIDTIKEDFGIQYSYITDLLIVPSTDKYKMSITEAISILIFIEICIVIFLVLFYKTQVVLICGTEQLAIGICYFAIILLLTYKIAYFGIIHFVRNETIIYNIMRTRHWLIFEDLIFLIVFVLCSIKYMVQLRKKEK